MEEHCTRRLETLSSKEEKRNSTQEQKKCRSPFHFLERHQNLYQQRPTPCPCSHNVTINPPIQKTLDVRDFFQIHVHTYSSCISKQSEEKFKTSYKGFYHTREDHVIGGKTPIRLRVFIYIFTHLFTHLFPYLFIYLFIILSCCIIHLCIYLIYILPVYIFLSCFIQLGHVYCIVCTISDSYISVLY